MLTARTALAPATLLNPDRTRAAWSDILNRTRRVPGVQAITLIDTVPMRDGSNVIGYRTSAAALPDIQGPFVLANCATPDYLSVMRIPLRAGRFLSDQDRKGSASVVVIDEAMAQQAFPGENPLGKQVWIGIGSDPATVVGVVRHVRQWGAADDGQTQVRAQLYHPPEQVPDNLRRCPSPRRSCPITDPLTLVESLRREIRGATTSGPVAIRTMEQRLRARPPPVPISWFLLSASAGLALLLACVGIYGVLRIPDQPARGERRGCARAASAGEVCVAGLLLESAMIFLGVVLGVSAAVAAARLLIRLVEGMQSTEPSTFALMILVLIVAALAASFVPARRASRATCRSACQSNVIRVGQSC